MLIKTIEELKAYVAVNAGLDIYTIGPYIRAAEAKYLVPAIGDELYTLMNETYTDTQSAMTAAELALLPLLQAAVAQLALFLWIPQAEVQITDQGITRVETSNSKTAYKNQVLNLMDRLIDAGYEALESVLVFLEKNTSSYPIWATSDARLDMNSLLVRNAREMKAFYTSLRQPQRTFLACASMMHTVEDIIITKNFGDAFTALKSKQAAGSLTALEKVAADSLKKAIVQLTMSKAITELEMRIDSTGITIMGTKADPQRGEDSTREAAEMLRVDSLAKQCAIVGAEYIDLTKDFMTRNASSTVFPEWYARIEAAKSTPYIPYINDQLNGAFGM